MMSSFYGKIFSLLIVTLFLLDASGQENKDESFKKAVNYYSSGNYSEALKIWKDLYSTGYRSAELAYNIGNAYFKLDSIPGAILFYERAYLLDPADEDINYNLQIVRSRVTDKIEEIPELFFIKWFNFLSLVLSSNAWARISLATFLLFLIFLSIFLYSPRYSYKVSGFWIALSMIFISVLSFSFSAKNRTLIYDSHKAVISTPVVSGKSSPDDSGTDLFVLHEGTKVSVEDEVGDWYEIRLSDGNKGWVHSNTIEII